MISISPERVSVFLIFISFFLIGFEQEYFSLIGKMAIYISPVILLCSALSKGSKFDFRLFCLVFPLIFWMFFQSKSWYGILLAFQFAFVIFFASLIIDSTKAISVISYRKFSYVLIFFLYVVISLDVFGYKLIGNSNYIGLIGLLLFCSRVSFSYNSVSFRGFLVYFLPIVFTTSKASAIAAIVCYFLVFFIPRLNKSIVLLLAFSFFFVNLMFVYTLFDVEFHGMDVVALEYTGKRFETGRVEMWNTVLSQLSTFDYFFGKGGGVDFSQFFGSNLSPHSTVIYVVASYGLLGLLLLALVITFVIKRLLNVGAIGAVAAIFALMVRDVFEVSLVHNSFPVAFLFWVIVGSWAYRVNKKVKFN